MDTEQELPDNWERVNRHVYYKAEPSANAQIDVATYGAVRTAEGWRCGALDNAGNVSKAQPAFDTAIEAIVWFELNQ